MSSYHQSVLLRESIEGLNIQPEGIYLDLTFGGGGHSKEILKKLNDTGKVLAFDQDTDASTNVETINAPNFQLIEANFRHFKRYLKLYQTDKVHGILADLGVSSHQIDTPNRGFSTRFQAKLDMRMDKKSDLTAQKILTEYNESELHKIFGLYGEVKNAKTLANTIVRSRLKKKIETVNDLKEILMPLAPKGKPNQYFAQVFQALRIEVNDELKALEEMLVQSSEILASGGRLVVLSYHSLEDRLVKNFIQKGKFKGEPEKDIYGNFYVPFKAITKKPILASAEEIALNNRARSVKMRIAEKI